MTSATTRRAALAGLSALAGCRAPPSARGPSGSGSGAGPGQGPAPASRVRPAVAPTPSPPPALVERLRAVAAGFSGRYGVSIRDLGAG